MCSTLEGLFEILRRKFRPKFNETIMSLQFSKLCRKHGENTEEWMGRLRIAAAECNPQNRCADTVAAYTHQGNALCMERHVQSATRPATSKGPVGAGGHGLLMRWNKRLYKTTPVKTLKW